MASDTFNRIYEVVKRIPKGKVSTYGIVATLAGNPRWSQVVGFALHSNPDNSIIPCHRVVNRFGRTAPSFKFGGADIQRSLLEAEGVTFIEDFNEVNVYFVDLERYLWRGE